MDETIRELKSSSRLPGQERIYIHGEKEYEQAENSVEDGVPLLKEIVESLEQAGEVAGVPFDLKPVG